MFSESDNSNVNSNSTNRTSANLERQSGPSRTRSGRQYGRRSQAENTDEAARNPGSVIRQFEDVSTIF